MKKLILCLLILGAMVGQLFAADKISTIEKQVDKEIYRTTLGESNDEVIIGDEVDSSTFKNKIKFTKWNKEESLTIDFNDVVAGNPFEDVDGKTKVKDKDNAVRFYYDRNSDEVMRLGIIWNEKPQQNFWIAKLVGYENFNFFYQPPLTQQDIDEGCHRPDNVIGSYVITHKTKRNNNYKCGIFAHWYRPKFLDSAGNWTWGILEYKDGIMTETCPPEFLGDPKTVYPVRSNADLGYTEDGGSEVTIGADLIYVFPIGIAGADAGLVTKIAIMTSNWGNPGRTCRFGLYSKTTVPNLIRDWTNEGTCSGAVTPTFNVWDATQSYSLVNGVGYYVAYWGDTGTVDLTYHSETYPGRSYHVHTYDGSTNWESPYIVDGTDAATKRYSVYVTYTAAGGVYIPFQIIKNEKTDYNRGIYLNGYYRNPDTRFAMLRRDKIAKLAN